MTANDVRERIDNAAEFRPEPPRPLRRELPPAEEYPVDALLSLAPAARAIQDLIQSPLALCGQSVLAVGSLVTQAHADVRLPYGQERPLSLFNVSVAASGERKSATDSEALRPVRRFEAELRQANVEERRAYEIHQAAYDAERRRILADKKTAGVEAKQQALDDLGPQPVAPMTPLITAPEPTFEGLTKLFASGRPSLGLFATEGGQLIGGHAMSEDNRLKTSAGLSGIWDGEPLRRVRAGDGASVLPGRRLALHIQVQPGVAHGLLSDRTLQDQGLLSRVLPAAPDLAAGTRFWREPSPASLAALQEYDDRMLAVLQAPLPLSPHEGGGLTPRALVLSPDTRELWVAFSDHIEAQLGCDGLLAPVRAFASKLAEHAVRIGAVLALVDDLDAGAVDRPHLEAGIELAQHYASEWLRLHDASSTRPEIDRAERLLWWLLDGWTEHVVGLPEVYRLGPNAIRDSRAAREAMAVLEEHGWVSRLEGGAAVGETFRREAWLIVGKEARQ